MSIFMIIKAVIANLMFIACAKIFYVLVDYEKIFMSLYSTMFSVQIFFILTAVSMVIALLHDFESSERYIPLVDQI